MPEPCTFVFYYLYSFFHLLTCTNLFRFIICTSSHFTIPLIVRSVQFLMFICTLLILLSVHFFIYYLPIVLFIICTFTFYNSFTKSVCGPKWVDLKQFLHFLGLSLLCAMESFWRARGAEMLGQ